MLRSAFIASLILISAVFADTLSERWKKRIESAEELYQTAIKKADDARLFAVRKAAMDRVRPLKSALADATKAGDFEAAAELKARLEAAEAAGGIRPKPKNTVKFGGHEYALLNERATWHLAKRMCEEMGGHLVVIETLDEEQFVLKLCGTQSDSVWFGATDEEIEGKWHWVNGAPLASSQIPRWHLTNEAGLQHHLCYWSSQFGDANAGARLISLCEWNP